MQIDILKAVDGISYPIKGEEVFSDDLFFPREIKADGAVKVEGEYIVSDEIVDLTFKLTLPLVALCDLCLDDVKYKVVANVQACSMKDTTGAESAYPYTGYVVDFTDVMKSEILFRIPERILCKKDCKGLCPTCGANRNREECGCAERIHENSPFAILKQTIAGGANDGSTKT